LKCLILIPSDVCCRKHTLYVTTTVRRGGTEAELLLGFSKGLVMEAPPPSPGASRVRDHPGLTLASPGSRELRAASLTR
jgi:hypothetical protein